MFPVGMMEWVFVPSFLLMILSSLIITHSLLYYSLLDHYLLYENEYCVCLYLLLSSSQDDAEHNLGVAFKIAEENLGIAALLEVQDMLDSDLKPDEICMMVKIV